MDRSRLKRDVDHRTSTALSYFQEALRADPRYAEPYAAAATMFQVASGLDGVPPDYAYTNGERMARQALEIDSLNAEAHATLGWALAVLRWDWSGNLREIQRAIALDPSNATAHSPSPIQIAAGISPRSQRNETPRGRKVANRQALAALANARAFSSMRRESARRFLKESWR